MDLDQEPSDWDHTVCIYSSYICSRQDKQMPFSGEYLPSALGE